MVFPLFLLLFAAVNGLGWVGDGPDVVGNGWDVMVKGLMLLGGYFSCFAIDRGSLRARSTRSIGDPLGLDRGSLRGDPLGLGGGRRRHCPIDRKVRRRSAAASIGRLESIDRGSLRPPPNPLKTPLNSAVSLNVDACTILPQPPQPSVGDPRGLDRLDRGSLRARSIGDPRGLDRLDRSGIP